MSQIVSQWIDKKTKEIMRTRTRKNDNQFIILKVFGIFLVVYGHVGSSMSLFMDNWFTGVMFHMPLFMFISGFFCDTAREGTVTSFVKKRFRRLVIPYFVWNFVYGVLVNLIKGMNFIQYGENITFHSFFIRPWLDGHQFAFNIPSWFLLSLFLVEIITVVVRKATKISGLLQEGFLFVMFALISYFSIVFSQRGYHASNWLGLLRVGYLLPFYQFGIFYRKARKRYKTNIWLYFGVILLAQFVLLTKAGDIITSVVFCQFTGKPEKILVYMILAILFWVKIAELLAPAVENSNALSFVGNHTFTIMMHHPIAIFLLNSFLYVINYATPLKGFNPTDFQINVWYMIQLPRVGVFYIIFAIALPCIICKAYEEMILLMSNPSKKQSAKEWIIKKRKSIIALVVVLVTVICGTGIGLEKVRESNTVVEYSDFYVTTGNGDVHVDESVLSFTGTEAGAKVCAAYISLEGIERINVQFEINCPIESVGSIVHVDLCTEGYDSDEQEFIAVLQPGRNVISGQLIPGQSAPEWVQLRIFTLDPAGYDVNCLRISK